MPSGAKKRKAAKKKLQKEAKNNTNNGAHPHPHQGNDDTKSHDERSSDGGEVERETSEEPVEHSNAGGGKKEVRLEEENGAEKVKQDEKFNDVTVEAENGSSESENVEESGEHKSSSSSSSSSDDEVAVEKEKPESVEEEKVEEQGQGETQETVLSDEALKPSDDLPEVASGVKILTSEVVENSIDESIAVEESVKEVVSLPQELNLVTGSVPLETSEAVQAELKQSIDEKLAVLDENGKVSSASVDVLQEKIETKMFPIADGGSGNPSEPVDTTVGDDNGVLPQSSGVATMDRSCEDNLVQESEKHEDPETQPLVPSAPIPVRRTSWMSCCGLCELLAGGSSR